MRIPQHGNAGELGNDLLEQLQSFARENSRHVGDPRAISSGSRQAIDKSRGNRISHAHENVRNSLANNAGGLSGIGRDGDENVGLKTDKFRCELKAVKVPVLMTILMRMFCPSI